MSRAFCVNTNRGQYDVLLARESDGAPEGATHVVFREDGSLAGFASEVGWAYGPHGEKLPSGVLTLEAGADFVAACDADECEG